MKKPGREVSGEEIHGFCEGWIGGYKRPRSVEFTEELPRNPSGKVVKKDLREKCWAGRARRVG